MMFLSPADDAEEAGLLPTSVLTPLGDHLPPQEPCFGCGMSILDRYYLIVSDRCWHTDCLKCCLCQCKLDQQTSCFCRDGMIFCRDDYYRQFSKRCTRCHRPLGYSDLVMKARDCIYHLQCFTCIICSSTLQPGEYFALGEHGVLYCQGHYEPLLAMSSGCDDSALPGEGLRTNRTKKRRLKSQRNNSDCSQMHLMSDSLDIIDLAGVNQHGRSKRMRTSFKHHQLRTMKAYFALNHNPDAKDLKQLAQKTGLTKRVLQVWFQNARAKYRRAVQTQPDDLKEDGGKTPEKSEGDLKNEENCSDNSKTDRSSVHSSINDYDMSKLSPALSEDSPSKTLAEYFNGSSESTIL